MDANAALVLIDIQNDYFQGGANPLSGSAEAGFNAGVLLNWFRNQALPVIHVRHHAVRPGSTFFIPGTHGADIHASVQPVPGEPVITKHYPNSFRETGLEAYLRDRHIENLVFCGMMTHMCVDATVRAARDMGFTCTLISDACATRDLEILGTTIPAGQVHGAFLAALAYYYAAVKPTDAFVRYG